MKRSDLTGTKQVFSFTLVQYLKSKSTISMLVMMFLLSGICMFSFFMSSGDMLSSIPGNYDMNRVLIANSTDLDIRAEDIAAYDSLLADVVYTVEKTDAGGGERDMTVLISRDETGEYTVDIYAALNEGYGSRQYYALREAAVNALNLASYRSQGITDEQMATAFAPYTVSTGDAEDVLAPTEPVSGFEYSPAYFVLSYVYSIIVMILVMFSTTYIIRSIVEEKDSKLVELLMVSVKPLALILGKILATMVFMVLSILALLAGFGVTSGIMSMFFDISSLSGILSSSGIGAGFDIGIGAGADVASGLGFILGLIILIPVVLISILLGYLTFSLMGGISGACCSSLDDINAANSAVTFTTLICYMVSIFAPITGSNGVVIFCSLCPFVSVFCAPVSFMTGRIGFLLLFISWLLQAVVIALLAAFCSRVYGALIIHKGNRIKLRQLFAIAREGGTKA